MALNYEELIATTILDIEHGDVDIEAMLYAQSVGFGRDPLDLKELNYVYEQGQPLQTVPTLASAIVPDMFPPDLGWDYSQVLHSEQRMRLYRPLPAAAELKINKRVVDAFDRGPSRGALILLEAEGRLASDDTVLFTLGCTIVARGGMIRDSIHTATPSSMIPNSCLTVFIHGPALTISLPAEAPKASSGAPMPRLRAKRVSPPRTASPLWPMKMSTATSGAATQGPTISADSTPMTPTPMSLPPLCWLLTLASRVWIRPGI